MAKFSKTIKIGIIQKVLYLFSLKISVNNGVLGLS